jgi:hypothetical protein
MEQIDAAREALQARLNKLSKDGEKVNVVGI